MKLIIKCACFLLLMLLAFSSFAQSPNGIILPLPKLNYAKTPTTNNNVTIANLTVQETPQKLKLAIPIKTDVAGQLNVVTSNLVAVQPLPPLKKLPQAQPVNKDQQQAPPPHKP